MQDDLHWFSSFNSSEEYKKLTEEPVAYFSAEFALTENLPIYAGGLGVLAGDMVKEAADREFPLIAVGLFYREGYVCQKIDKGGMIIEACDIHNPQDFGLEEVKDASGSPIVVRVPIHDRYVLARAWRNMVKTVPVFFLDTNIDGNSHEDRTITNRLYVNDKETRLKQEMILGIGGIRLLELLGIHPSIYHLNEGHSAMLILDLVRHEKEKQKVSFEDAISLAKQHIIFTNHTLVTAGNEVFSNDLVSTMLEKYAEELAVPAQDIVSLGLVQESSRFSMTMMSLRIAQRSNAVSKLHQKKATEIWTDHPMEAVTNGVHVPTWSEGGDIVANHAEKKRELLRFIAATEKREWSENDFLIGWARRIVSYKRPLALFEDIKAFLQLASSAERPVRVVISGFAPPGDKTGADLLQKIEHLSKNELRDYLVYLPGYNIGLAKQLVAGVDIWLNTPVIGFEACGTSGMKAALNGVLPVSTRDGWIDEVELFGVGWVLNDLAVQESIISHLTYEILPMYYEKKDLWATHMKNARDMASSQFSATRMLRRYIEKMYLPVLQSIGH